MSLEKGIAIVLRIVEFSESSCVVTLMTREFGKITVLAKGARRRKSPFEGALDLLSLTRIVFLHKKSEALDILTEARLERRFQSAGRKLDRLYSAYYVVELLAALTDEADPHPELFDLAERVLLDIDQGRELMTQVCRFELGALSLLGHRPMLDRCVECGCELSVESERADFGLLAGGVYCPPCRRGKTSVVSLSNASWRSLIDLSRMENEKKVLSSDCQGELRPCLNQYLSHHLGYRPRLQKYISGTGIVN